MLGPMTALLFAGLTQPAMAMTPPAGWTATGPYRAVRDANNPGMGELREFNVTGGTGNPAELGMMLRSAGAEAKLMNPDGAGAVGLALQDERLGKARFKGFEGGVTWMVVMAAPNMATTMDPDAILTAAFTPAPVAAPASTAAAWGAPAAPAAAPWGQVGGPTAANVPVAAPVAAATTPAWGQGGVPAQAAWGVGPELIGVWEGTAFIKFAPTKLNFTFGADGTLTLVRRANGREETLTGKWGSRPGQLKLEIPGGADSLPYAMTGNSMGFAFEGTKVTLTKK
jgi:hypothetical protein